MTCSFFSILLHPTQLYSILLPHLYSQQGDLQGFARSTAKRPVGPLVRPLNNTRIKILFLCTFPFSLV